MTTSVLAAAMFSLLCWALPKPNGEPVMTVPPQPIRGPGSASSGWTTNTDSWSSSDNDEALPANEPAVERPRSESDDEAAAEDSESNSDSLGGRTLVLGEER